jgi:plasmid stabilization system protein ParE
VDFRRVAAGELVLAQEWYDDQQMGLGDEFAQCVQATVHFIRDQPEALQQVMPRQGVRRALVKRFPYAVYFIIEPRRVVVLAVLHVARSPDVWRNRR